MCGWRGCQDRSQAPHSQGGTGTYVCVCLCMDMFVFVWGPSSPLGDTEVGDFPVGCLTLLCDTASQDVCGCVAHAVGWECHQTRVSAACSAPFVLVCVGVYLYW